VVGLGVCLDYADSRRDEGEEDQACWARNLRTRGRSVCSVVVLILFFLVPSPVRVSLVGTGGIGSLGVCGLSSKSILPTFSKVSPC